MRRTFISNERSLGLSQARLMVCENSVLRRISRPKENNKRLEKTA
jgi:hypothetical protein